MRKGREEWEQDIYARQRNIVFPDTAQNEARFWRNLANGKQKAAVVQVVGILLLLFGFVAVLAIDAALRYPYEASGSVFERLYPFLVDLGILLAFFGLMFIVLCWRARKALQKGHRRAQPHSH